MIQCLLSHMAALVVVIPIAKLRMRPLQMCFLRQFRPAIHSEKKSINLPAEVTKSHLGGGYPWSTSCKGNHSIPLAQTTSSLWMPRFWDGEHTSGPWVLVPVVSSELGASHKLPSAQGCHTCCHVLPPISGRFSIGHTINQQGGDSFYVLVPPAMAFWELPQQ